MVREDKTARPVNLDLNGQRVVVTAGGSGIGRAIAECFLHQGASVHVCDISGDAISDLISSIPDIRGAVADVGDPESVSKYFAGVVDDLGGVDVLVNNAGVGGPRAPIEEVAIEDWDRTLRVNLSGMFYCIRQAVPFMKRQKSGCIINISTVNAKIGLPLRTPYVASKAGVLGLTVNVARELGPCGIRCNAILPGPIDNPRGRGLVENHASARGLTIEEAEADFLKYISMRSWITPGEVGDMATFLASPAARHVSGQSIGVCGNMEWES